MAAKISSMTGYAVVTRELPQGVFTFELRAVNNRFLDLQFRMPEEVRAFEPPLRELIASKVGRGKVECRVSVNAGGDGADAAMLDEAALAQLLHLAARVQALAPSASALGTAEILRWPGVLTTQSLAGDALRDMIVELCGEALTQFNASREREGEKLRGFLVERADAVAGIIADVKPRIPALLAAQRDKLLQRLADTGIATEPDRLTQELVIYAAKIDVEEELSRLAAHVDELRRTLARGGPVGKRLDFLMQEFNRESNTIGSKSVDTQTTQAAIELKVLIEQMREQVQNIE
ncbi:MAG: YicC family protein [Proteobacteria bacterium]|nr:YicC family protein [Burkholderiales bacterium]